MQSGSVHIPVVLEPHHIAALEHLAGSLHIHVAEVISALIHRTHTLHIGVDPKLQQQPGSAGTLFALQIARSRLSELDGLVMLWSAENLTPLTRSDIIRELAYRETLNMGS